MVTVPISVQPEGVVIVGAVPAVAALISMDRIEMSVA